VHVRGTGSFSSLVAGQLLGTLRRCLDKHCGRLSIGPLQSYTAVGQPSATHWLSTVPCDICLYALVRLGGWVVLLLSQMAVASVSDFDKYRTLQPGSCRTAAEALL
jgi:hypothetical protein